MYDLGEMLGLGARLALKLIRFVFTVMVSVDAVEYLQLLHTRRLMIRFDDSEVQQEREINCLTEEITALFHKADRSLKKITSAFVGGEPSPSPADRLVRLNTQRAIAGRLQEISIQFRTRQREYLQRLQLQKFGSEIFDVDAMEKGAGIPSESFRFGNKATAFAMDRTEYDIRTRDIEIQRIAKSVATLATMFKEVAEMVIDQGTLIDRIDYNMEQVVERMRSGLGQLERAEKYQRNTRPERCIFLLLTLITLCFFILVMKHS
ncbi:hypothetical protein V7S43_011488 [Phytophthora oleae]|uniref:t-SNARE coiled-coil homology domain-containing protein n=1 Tax=Phytophthora oleae TaxID=2107226 RepID=A0ABD3FBC7_9STRA